MKNNLLCATAFCAISFLASAQQFPSPQIKTQTAGDGSNAGATDAFAARATNAYPQLYGFRGDGTTHPLSELYSALPLPSMNGMPLCPEATELSDTQDWCAFQTALDYIQANSSASGWLGLNGYKIHIPATGHSSQFGTKTLVINTPAALQIEGDGELQSEIVHTGSTDFLSYGLGATGTTGSLKLRDFTVFQNGTGGVAFNLRFNQTHPTLDVDMVKVSGYGAINAGTGFATEFLCNGCDDLVLQHMTLRGDYQMGLGDIPAISATSNSITFSTATLPANLAPGETLDDLTSTPGSGTQNIPDACTIGSISVSGTFTVITPSCAVTVVAEDDIQIRSDAISFYATSGLLGKFVYTIKDSFMGGNPSGCITIHAHSSIGIQGVVVKNNGCGYTNDFVDLFNSYGNALPWYVLDGNQVQIDGNFFHGESVYNLKATNNGLYSGPGTGAIHPTIKPSITTMFEMVNIFAGAGVAQGNFNQLMNNSLAVFPGSAPFARAVTMNDNHDQYLNNQWGSAAIAPLSEIYQPMTGSANTESTSDKVFPARNIVASAAQVAGDTHVTLTGIAGVNGWTPHYGQTVTGFTNPASLPSAGCLIDSVSGSVVNFQSGCAVLAAGIGAGDTLTIASAAVNAQDTWVTEWGATVPSGSSTLQIEPYFVAEGLLTTPFPIIVKDITPADSQSIPDNCTASINGTTGIVTLENGCVTTGPVVGGALPGFGDVLTFEIPASNNTPIAINAPMDYLLTGATPEVIPTNYDDFLLCPNGPATHAVSPPPAPHLNQHIIIKDCVGIAGTYPIVWNGKTEGNTTTSISTNWGSLSVRWNGSQWFQSP